MRYLHSRLTNWATKAYLFPYWRSFQHALRQPMIAQKERLFSLLHDNQNTYYGKRFEFAKIAHSRSIRSFQKNVPIVGYEDILPYIQRVAAGEQGVLTADPVLVFERSSGSSSASKLIPMTQSLLHDFQQGIYPWLFDMMHRHPQLKSTTSYWSISTLARSPEVSSAGIPIGLADDTAYFGEFLGWSMRQNLSVPSRVATEPDMEACRHATNLYLLADKNLGFISVWSPTFLILLVQQMLADFPQLLVDLERGKHGVHVDRQRITYLRNHAVSNGQLNIQAIWPHLRLISCWTSASSKPFLRQLKQMFPTVVIEGKGLLATEGIITIPWGEDASYVPCVRSHFFEFLEVGNEDCTPYLLDELQVKRQYIPLMSTGGGLYRYRLGDVVEVTGKIGRCPLLSFVGRADQRTDLCGEKLQPIFVANALQRVQDQLGIHLQFAMLAPEVSEESKYLLFAEGHEMPVSQLSKALDDVLCHNHHYRQCRRLGQLSAVEVVPVSNGMYRYERQMISQGVKAGDLKATPLHHGLKWRQLMLEEV